MRLFDLHCDTVTECRKAGCTMQNNTMHLDFSRGRRYDAWVQTFAVWIPDTLRGDDAWTFFLDNALFFRSEAERHNLPLCDSFDTLCAALSQHRAAALFAVEGGAVLGGKLERIDAIRRMGVRILTLTWNGENELACGCQTPGGGGLKPFGFEALQEMEKCGILPDVSHLHGDGFYDVLRATDMPVLATHSTSAEVLRQSRSESLDKRFSLRRALEDAQIRALAAHGGLIGLNLCGSFLGDPGDDGMQAALRHAQHILRAGGEDILALGSDFDGCKIHPDMAGVEKMSGLYDFFRKNGISEAVCTKIFFQNALQFFKNVL